MCLDASIIFFHLVVVVDCVEFEDCKCYSFVVQNEHGIDKNIIQTHNHRDDDDEQEEGGWKKPSSNTSFRSFAKICEIL